MDYSQIVSDITDCKSPRCKARIRYIRMAKSGKQMPVENPIICVADRPQWIGEKLVTPFGQMVTATEGTLGYEPHWGNCADSKRFHAKKSRSGSNMSGDLERD